MKLIHIVVVLFSIENASLYLIPKTVELEQLRKNGLFDKNLNASIFLCCVFNRKCIPVTDA